MHPDYEKYRTKGIDTTTTYRVNLLPELRAKIETIAFMENDSLGALFIEGIARVIESREKDSSHMAQSTEALQSRIDIMQAILNSAKSSSEQS